MTTRPRVTVVVPTLGNSPVFQECLDALAASRGATAQIVVVDGSRTDSTSAFELPVHQRIAAPSADGFAESCNLGLASCATPYAAIVNDDAVVEPDWLQILVAALDNDPQVAAAQGLNLQLRDPAKIDGCGIAWNSRWQPIQIGYGSARSSPHRVSEIFGASATAAVYRFDALARAAVDPEEVFDTALHTYYDDVDLAIRLRSAGYRALFVPSALASHAGGASTPEASEWRAVQLHSNRLLVVARLLGRSFWLRLPVILRPDLAELVRAIGLRQGARVRGVLKGWWRAACGMPRFSHWRQPLVPIHEVVRLGQDVASGPGDS